MPARSKLVLEFGRTTSPNRKRAVALARSLRHHEQHGDGRDARHVCPIALRSERELKAALELLRLTASWKSAEVLLDGVPQAPWHVQRVLTCALEKRRKGSERRAHHCAWDEPRDPGSTALVRVPCRLVEHDPRARVEWWQHGELRDGVFHVDRTVVHKELRSRAEVLGCGWCPGFEQRCVKTVVARLPRQIEPGETWTVRKVSGKPAGVVPARSSSAGLQIGIDLSELLKPRGEPQKPAAEPKPPENPPEGPPEEPDDVSQDSLTSPVRFADIGGLDEPIRQVRELIELPLRRPEVFEHLGIEPPKGVLLTGPPGCGKTLIGKALAHESGARFHAVTVTELLSKYVGESEANLRRLFERAAKSPPAIVFLDEIDALGYDRGGAQHGWEVGPLTQLLGILDGFRPLRGVAVLGATNRPERLDPALVRPGRFDRVVEIPPPGLEGRRVILGIHTARMPLAKDVDLDALAAGTEECTGAELRGLCQAAGLAAVRRVGEEGLRRVRVTASDFAAAIGRSAVQ